MQTRTSLNGAMIHITVMLAQAGIHADYVTRTAAVRTPACAGAPGERGA